MLLDCTMHTKTRSTNTCSRSKEAHDIYANTDVSCYRRPTSSAISHCAKDNYWTLAHSQALNMEHTQNIIIINSFIVKNGIALWAIKIHKAHNIKFRSLFTGTRGCRQRSHHSHQRTRRCR